MGSGMTAAQLRKHLPKLCKRLDKYELYSSLVDVFGEADEQIIRKKLENNSQWDGTIIMDIYTAVKRILGTDHVDRFLQAVQQQFDLASLGITFEPPNSEERKIQPPEGRPPPPVPVPSLPPLPCQQRGPQLTMDDPATRQAPDSAPAFSDPPKHVQHCPARTSSGPSDNLPVTRHKHASKTFGFQSFDGSGKARNAAQGSEMRRALSSKTGAMVTAISGSSQPSVAAHSRIDRSPELSEITLQDILANISRKDATAPLQHSSLQSQPGFYEQRPDDRVPFLNSDALKSRNQMVPETLMTNNTANPTSRPANVPFNIFASVEDNEDQTAALDDVMEYGKRLSFPAGGPPELSQTPSVRTDGNLLSTAPDKAMHVHVQTDGDLPTEVIPPEPTGSVMENSGPSGCSDPQSATPPMNPTVGTAPPVTICYHIGKIVVRGEGNHVGVGQHIFHKRSPSQERQRTSHGEHDDEFPVLPQAAASRRFMEHLDDASRERPVTEVSDVSGDHLQTRIQDRESSPELQQLPSGTNVSLNSSSNYSLHHGTHPKEKLSEEDEGRMTTSDVSEGQETNQKTRLQEHESSPELQELLCEADVSLFCSSNNSLHHRTELKGKWPHEDEGHGTTSGGHQSSLKKRIRDRENSPELQQLPRLSVFCTSSYSLHHGTQPKGIWPDEDEGGSRTSSCRDSYNSPMSDQTQDPDSRIAGQEAAYCQGSDLAEISKEQKRSLPTPCLANTLLGPEELRRYEARRDVSIEIPAYRDLLPDDY